MHLRQTDVVEARIAPSGALLQPGDDRPERGIDRSGAAVADAAVIAGESYVLGSEMVAEVDVQRVTHGADDRHLVHHSRMAGSKRTSETSIPGTHVLLSRHRVRESSAGAWGLGVVCFMLGRTAVEPDEDDGKIVRIPRIDQAARPSPSQRRLKPVRPMTPAPRASSDERAARSHPIR